MTTNKELEKEVEELKNFPVKLSWKQIWCGIGIFLTVIGSSFGAGFKVQSEIEKVERAKLESEYMKKIGVLDEKTIELNRQLKESQEDCIFFQNRYKFLSEKTKELEKELEEKYN